MPKYLLRLRKTSFLLIDRSSSISVGSNKASSKAEATWHPILPLKFLRDASSLKGSPLSMGAGSQAWDSSGWLSPLSTPLNEVWPIFYLLDLIFMLGVRPPCFCHILTLLLSLSFWVSRTRFGWQGRLRRRRKKRFGRRRREFGLGGFSWCTSSGLRLY